MRNIIKKEQEEANRQKELMDRRKKRKEIALRVIPHLMPDSSEERRLTEVVDAVLLAVKINSN